MNTSAVSPRSPVHLQCFAHRATTRSGASEQRVVARLLPLVTALVFAGLGATGLMLGIVAEVPARSGDDQDREAVARRFYAAINEAVRTGNVSLLERVVAAESVDAASMGFSSPQCSLRCRVAALHRLAPQLRLVVNEVLVDGDRVAVRLTAQGHDRSRFLGLPLQGVLAPWGPIDLLRIEEGRVVAMQPAAGPSALIAPLLRTDVDILPPAPYRLGLLRLTLEPGAAIPRRPVRGPLVVLVERGTLEVVVDRSVRLSRHGRDGFSGSESIHLAGTTALVAGEHLALEAQTSYGLRNRSEAAVVLLVVAALPGDGGITNRWVRSRTLEETLVAAPIPETVAQTEPPPTWPAGVRSEVLADGIVRDRATPSARVELTRMTLPPHAALPVHAARGVEMVALEAGTAVIDLVGGQGAIRPWPGATRVDVGTDRTSAVPGHRLSPGGGILHVGASAGIRNVDDEPLTLLMLTLEPGSQPP